MIRKLREDNSGLSLVELLVVLAIGMLLLGGVYQLFISNLRTYSVTSELSFLQEEGQMALYALRSEIIGAGYIGCAQQRRGLLNVLPSANPPAVDFEFDFANAVSDPADIPPGVLSNPPPRTTANTPSLLQPSDFIVIRGVRKDFPEIITREEFLPTETVLEINDDLDLEEGTILLISDCNASCIFWAGEYDAVTGELALPLTVAPAPPVSLGSRGFAQGAELHVLQTQIFYVADNPLNGEPALYLRRNFMNPPSYQTELLAEGVEMMKVLYGEDTNNDGLVDTYHNAASVLDWTNVMSMRIALLLRSAGQDSSAPLDNRIYDLFENGTDDFDASLARGSNRAMRLVFSGTISLRNRVR